MTDQSIMSFLYPMVRDLTDAEYSDGCCAIAASAFGSFSMDDLITPATSPIPISSPSSSSSRSTEVEVILSSPQLSPIRIRNGNSRSADISSSRRKLFSGHKERSSRFSGRRADSLEEHVVVVNNDPVERSPPPSPSSRNSSFDFLSTTSTCSCTSVGEFYEAVTDLIGPSRPFEEIFVLTQQVLEGKTSTIWECVHRKDGERYCVKVFDRRKFLSDTDEACMLREIDVLKALLNEPSTMKSRSPRFIELLQVFEDQEPNCNLTYLVTDLVPTGNLLDRMRHLEKRNELLNEGFVKRLARSLLEGLRHLHSLNICHHALRPEHILCVNPKGDVKICDFGYAYHVVKSNHGSNDDSWHCSCCVVHRSPGKRSSVVPPILSLDRSNYCNAVHQLQHTAPEMHQHKTHGTVTDLWSVGVTLYFCLSGQLPFGPDRVSSDSILEIPSLDEQLKHPSFILS